MYYFRESEEDDTACSCKLTIIGGEIMSVKLIIDSACDMPEDFIEEFNLEIIPFIINIGKKSYYDGEDITTPEVYEAMREGKDPTTDQVPAGKFQEVFKREAEKGNDIIYLSFSSELSGTYQTGCMIAEQVQGDYPDVDIKVIDSKSGSAATGIMAYRAAKMLRKGMGKEEVVNSLKNWIGNIEHLFYLNTLDALRRGGRISRSKSFIGNFLSIKPLLTVVDGEIQLKEKVRGSKNALEKLVTLFENKCTNIPESLVAITHADDLERAKELKNKIEDLGGEIFCLELINSVLGVHLGIGGVGLFFLND